MKKETIKYFEVNDPRFARFYLIVVITGKTPVFLDFHLQALAQAVKLYIKDTNDFLNKLCSLPKLLDNIILCMVDVVGLYPNIPHKEGLSALRKQLDNRVEWKNISQVIHFMI